MNIKRKYQYYLEGSLTVEAALVMSVLLLFIASLITGVFEIHTRVAGNLVLQETLEKCMHLEEQQIYELEREAKQDYRGYFWCGDGSISLEESADRFSGVVKDKSETSITLKKFDPENFLRLIRAFGV